MMTKIHKLSKQNGFTLIELIIVIVILGILAAVGIPRFMNSKKEAWASSCKTNRSTLDDACERYHFDTTNWPGSQGTLIGGSYIKNAFNCPSSNTSDTYIFTDASTGVTCKNMNDKTSDHYHE